MAGRLPGGGVRGFLLDAASAIILRLRQSGGSGILGGGGGSILGRGLVVVVGSHGLQTAPLSRRTGGGKWTVGEEVAAEVAVPPLKDAVDDLQEVLVAKNLSTLPRPLLKDGDLVGAMEGPLKQPPPLRSVMGHEVGATTVASVAKCLESHSLTPPEAPAAAAGPPVVPPLLDSRLKRTDAASEVEATFISGSRSRRLPYSPPPPSGLLLPIAFLSLLLSLVAVDGETPAMAAHLAASRGGGGDGGGGGGGGGGSGGQ